MSWKNDSHHTNLTMNPTWTTGEEFIRTAISTWAGAEWGWVRSDWMPQSQSCPCLQCPLCELQTTLPVQILEASVRITDHTCTSYDARLMRKPNQTCFITLSTPLSCQKDVWAERRKVSSHDKKWSITGDMVQVQTCECTMRRRNPPKEDCSLIHGHTTALHFSSVVEV